MIEQYFRTSSSRMWQVLEWKKLKYFFIAIMKFKPKTNKAQDSLEGKDKFIFSVSSDNHSSTLFFAGS